MASIILNWLSGTDAAGEATPLVVVQPRERRQLPATLDGVNTLRLFGASMPQGLEPSLPLRD